MAQPDFEVVKSLPLTKALHYAGDEIGTLHFREPTAGLLDTLERARKAKKPQSESLVVLAWFTKVGLESLKRLSWADTQDAMSIVGDLLGTEFDGNSSQADLEPWESDTGAGEGAGPS